MATQILSVIFFVFLQLDTPPYEVVFVGKGGSILKRLNRSLVELSTLFPQCSKFLSDDVLTLDKKTDSERPVR